MMTDAEELPVGQLLEIDGKFHIVIGGQPDIIFSQQPQLDFSQIQINEKGIILNSAVDIVARASKALILSTFDALATMSTAEFKTDRF